MLQLFSCLSTSKLFNTAEYKSRKKRWMPEPKVLVVALCFLICIPSTKGISIEFGNSSVDHWEFLFGANSQEIKYDYCKYNATSGGQQCKSLTQASVDFEKVCNCTVQLDGTNEGSFFAVNCKSGLSHCPKKLSLTYEQGSYIIYARAPDPDVETSGRNDWLVVSIILIALNVFAITIILYLCKEKVQAFLKPKWNQFCSCSRSIYSRIMDWARGQLLPLFRRRTAAGSATGEEPETPEIPLLGITGNTPQVPIPRGSTSAGNEMGEPIESLDVFLESDERGDAHKRPEGKANLGFFESEIDGRVTRQNADNVCVLVIHYDFKNDPKRFRSGHKCDINNLKTSFGENRNCNFRNLSPNKKTLLQLLGDQEELLQFFKTHGDVPSVFVLFILSHGEENGKIWTDNLDKETDDYESFTTDEVFDSLQKLQRFDKCLKIVNFGPCRGSLEDFMIDGKIKNHKFENRNSCRITTRPGMHNFVVFYSTVETKLAKTDEKGSWFVQNICACLNEANDESLLNFLTIVQNRLHQASHNNSEKNTPFGQTPELKMYTQDRKFMISRAKILASSSPDASCNKRTVNKKRFSEYFSWKSDKGQDIRGRIGFILSVARSKLVQEMKGVLQTLDFEVSDWKLSSQSLDFYRRMMSELEPDVGCIMTCIFGPVCENQEKEVCVRVQTGQEIPITDIQHSLVGPKSNRLIGKPKILFVVNVEAPQTDSISVHMKDWQVCATNHSGWLVLILKNEDALEKLIQLFGKIGEKSLQELVEPLLIRESGREDVVLFNSTLQYLVKFPDWPVKFVKPDFKLKKAQIRRDQLDNSKNSVTGNIKFDELLNMAKRLFEENKNSIESPIGTISRLENPHIPSDIEHSIDSNFVRDSIARDRTDASIVWLFNSVAGAGKSTVLKEMAHQLTRLDGGFKILRIPLKKYEWYIIDMPAGKVDETVFLANTTCNSHDDIKNWIAKRELVVFLDGFDEVCPDFREKKTNILIALNNARVPIFIGTRPHEAHHIQDRIQNTTIVEIEPLDDAKQNVFLEIVARKNQQELEQIRKKFKKQDILGNPLYLKLLAEYSGDGNLYEIFDKIVRRKVEIYLKKEYEVKDVGQEWINKELRVIQLVASRFVRGVKIEHGSVTKEKLEKINYLGVGTYCNDRVNFTPQTFAEFLTAQKYINDLKNPVDEKVPLFNKELVHCRKFVDLFLSTEKGKDASYAEAFVDFS